MDHYFEEECTHILKFIVYSGSSGQEVELFALEQQQSTKKAGLIWA
jgi:hypothetical protein